MRCVCGCGIAGRSAGTGREFGAKGGGAQAVVHVEVAMFWRTQERNNESMIIDAELHEEGGVVGFAGQEHRVAGGWKVYGCRFIARWNGNG